MSELSSITPFDFNGAAVRVLVDEDGSPWFVVNDVCSVLKITNPRNAVDRIDGGYVRQADVTDSLGRPRETNLVSEPGLYELIFRSDKPIAAKFRKWVFEEVLPSIRKTGSYSVIPVKPDDDLAVLETMIQNVREHRQRLRAIEARVDSIEGHYDWFTTLAYARLNNLPGDRVSCQRHGQRASKLMRSRGQEPVKRQDATLGEINTYPLDVLNETAERPS